MNHNQKIAVLLGGASKERDISLSTGRAIAKALRDQGYSNVHEIDPSEIENFYEQHWDVAFNALHGEGGEDGEIQKVLEQHKIPYTGSRSEASARSMSKIQTKEVFVKERIATLPFLGSNKEDSFESFQKKVTKQLKFPIIGKPDSEGSSIGMQIVHSKDDLEEAFHKAHTFGDWVLWEEYMDQGIDLTVTILKGQALPVIEIRPLDGLYDFESKYTKGKTNYYCPARISDALKDAVQRDALKAFEVLGCRSWGRVDFIWIGDKAYCLEVNTVPGMTPTSLVPMSAKEKGLSFEKLVEEILQDAC